jgi:hypothetical protein
MKVILRESLGVWLSMALKREAAVMSRPASAYLL